VWGVSYQLSPRHSEIVTLKPFFGLLGWGSSNPVAFSWALDIEDLYSIFEPTIKSIENPMIISMSKYVRTPYFVTIGLNERL
jgi:hypothetical protein